MEISEYGIIYKPRRAIKGQALAGLVEEMIGPEEPQNWTWKIHIDGASPKSKRGASVVMQSPGGSIIEQSIEISFPITNNQAEYEELIVALKLSKNMRAKEVAIYSVSQLVVQQMTGEFEVKDPTIQLYTQKAKQLIEAASMKVTFIHIPIMKNGRANTLAKMATKPTKGGRDSRGRQYTSTLSHNILPKDKNEAKKVARRSRRFVFKQGTLYRKSSPPPVQNASQKRTPPISYERYMKESAKATRDLQQ